MLENDITTTLQQLHPSHVTVTKVDTCADSYKITIISEEFNGLKTLQRHKKVNALLKPYMTQIHAIEIVTKTAAESVI